MCAESQRAQIGLSEILTFYDRLLLQMLTLRQVLNSRRSFWLPAQRSFEMLTLYVFFYFLKWFTKKFPNFDMHFICLHVNLTRNTVKGSPKANDLINNRIRSTNSESWMKFTPQLSTSVNYYNGCSSFSISLRMVFIYAWNSPHTYLWASDRTPFQLPHAQIVITSARIQYACIARNAHKESKSHNDTHKLIVYDLRQP